MATEDMLQEIQDKMLIKWNIAIWDILCFLNQSINGNKKEPDTFHFINHRICFFNWWGKWYYTWYGKWYYKYIEFYLRDTSWVQMYLSDQSPETIKAIWEIVCK